MDPHLAGGRLDLVMVMLVEADRQTAVAFRGVDQGTYSAGQVLLAAADERDVGFVERPATDDARGSPALARSP